MMFSGVGRAVLPVADAERALGFYRDALGFEVLHDSDAGGFRYLHVGVPGQAGVGLWLFPGDGPGGEGRPALVLYTDDLDAVRARLLEHEAEVWNERADADSRSLHFRDSEGNVVIAAQLSR